MKHGIVALLLTSLLVCGTLFAFTTVNTTAYAAPPLVSCKVSTATPPRVVCQAAGVVVLNTVIQVPTIHAPGQTVTIQVPGPTVTHTVRLPGSHPTSTQTIEVPGPTSTITKTVHPGPRPTVTETIRSRQHSHGSGTLEPRDTLPPTHISATVKAVFGIVASLFLIALILIAMYAGYYMGWKDCIKDDQKSDISFMKSLLRKD